MVIARRKYIFFVDDEPKICKSVGIALESEDYHVTLFTDAQKCFDDLGANHCDLLITDVKMPEMSGLSLLMKVRQSHPILPVILITGYGDVSMAVKAMKSGANDFIQKPIDRGTLIDTVKYVFKDYAEKYNANIQKLTKVEYQVLKLIVEGMSNRGIAHLLHRSIRTIEDHRNHIMHKFGVHNVVELVKIAMRMKLNDIDI